MIRCNICPYCRNPYQADKVDSDGNYYCICGMTGNIVYPYPRLAERYSGSGYYRFDASSCGIFNSVDDVLTHMAENERKR